QRVGPRLLGRLAAVALFQQRQFFSVLGDLVRQAHQQPAALGGAELGPYRVVALARGRYGGIDVLGAAALQFVEALPVGRVDHRDRAGGRRRLRLVGNVVELHANILLESPTGLSAKPCSKSTRRIGPGTTPGRPQSNTACDARPANAGICSRPAGSDGSRGAG